MTSQIKGDYPNFGSTSSEFDEVDMFRAQREQESPRVNTEAMAIFGRIYRISTKIAPHIEAVFAQYGLDRGEYDVLATLQRCGHPYRLTPTNLYTSLMVSSGGLTHRLKRLESRGFIRRFQSPHDGRSFMVELTELGYDLTTQAFEHDMQLENSWLDALTDVERKKLAELLRRLNASVPGFGKFAAEDELSTEAER